MELTFAQVDGAMNRFAELLDRLVLTPSRNGKLTLLADYFRDVHDPDRGLCACGDHRRSRHRRGEAGHAARAGRRAHGSGAVRLFLRLCRRSRRDRFAGLAGTRARAPITRRRLAEVVEKLQSASRSDGPAVLAACSTSAGISARFAIIKLVTGGLRIGVSARLAKQALADFGEGRRRRDRGTLARADAALRDAVRVAGGQGAKARDSRPGRCSARSCCRIPSRTTIWRSSTRPTMSPSGNGTASASRQCRSADVGGFIRAPATIFPAPSPIWSTPWISTPRSTANCWSARRRDWTGTFSDLQQRLNRKTVVGQDARAFPGLRALLRPVMQVESEDFRPLPFVERRQRLEDFVGLLDAVTLRSLAHHPLRQLGGA